MCIALRDALHAARIRKLRALADGGSEGFVHPDV
jgi:hypothetical protein